MGKSVFEIFTQRINLNYLKKNGGSISIVQAMFSTQFCLQTAQCFF